ncbi:glycosyltransferase family 9 protein [Mangrovimonas sp. TPBH4]|uniref:glycosyltransferase family 9 protein n=1 Tax=Mangrovimonas sp. TPBH4 TaxID=1645914 RepID=UPI0006B608AB|nr:glycosyltransferase family 9 protein [Mangrovimonas sp. TPBH4]
MKILIIQKKMIGDVLTTSILFEALKKKYPKSELHYVINNNTYPVVENNPFIDRFLFVTPEIKASKLKFLNFLKVIKKEEYDIVVDVYSKFTSGLMAAFSGAEMKISQHKSYTSYIYTHTFENKKVPATNAGLAIENRLQLLHPISESLSETIIKPKIYLTDNEKSSAKERLVNTGISLEQPLFMIGVLGSANTKTYPLPHMAKLIDAIVAKTQGQILFNYIPNQITEAKTVYNFCNKATKKHIYFDVFGKSIREFLALTNHCSALIGNEGGAVNMAKALEVPTFTIFSPWIKKEAWNMFENGTTNVSVHLKDEKPELYEGKSLSDMKDDVFALYEAFPPELILPKLENYLNQF